MSRGISAFPGWTMAEIPGYTPNPAMGIDLRDRQGRSPAPAQSHRPAGRKRAQQVTADRILKRSDAPELPRLRAPEAQAASMPISSSPGVGRLEFIHTQLGRLLRVLRSR